MRVIILIKLATETSENEASKLNAVGGDFWIVRSTINFISKKVTTMGALLACIFVTNNLLITGDAIDSLFNFENVRAAN